MLETGRPQQLIALTLIGFCLIAVVIGIVQLSKTDTSVTTVATGSGPSGALLGGSGERLALIKLEGMITESGEDSGLFESTSSAPAARKLLYVAAKDDDVKGVLLRINSPGGTVGMSQELYDAVLAVRKEKPVVVSMGDLAASGGYYTAAAADHIIANPGTLTASIGVILQSVNMQGLLSDKLGVKAITVKSGKFKDILSPYRQPTKDDLALLQKLIDTSYQQFLAAVLNGRTMGMTDKAAIAKRRESLTAIADGRVVVGEEALKVGLVDELGGLEAAKNRLQEMAGKKFKLKHPDHLSLQEYEIPFDIFEFLGASAHSLTRAQSLEGLSLNVLPKSFKYANQPLWLMESY